MITFHICNIQYFYWAVGYLFECGHLCQLLGEKMNVEVFGFLGLCRTEVIAGKIGILNKERWFLSGINHVRYSFLKRWGSVKSLQKVISFFFCNSLFNDNYFFFWLSGTKAFEKISEELTKTRLKNDVKKMSHIEQTSAIEAFHSVLLYWCPKMLAYSYAGMVCR